MRSSVTLFGTAVLAVAFAGVGTTQAQAADSAGSASRADRAIAGAKSHAAATHFGTSQGFKAVDTIVDPDGTTHVRLHRTYRGLDVVGGDLVVHESKSGAWKGSSQTLAKTLDLAVAPAVASSVAKTRALAPSAVTRKITDARVDGSSLVVDASGATPRLAWKVLSGGVQDNGTPSRLATYVDAKTGQVIRPEQEIENVDGTGTTLWSGQVPLSVTKSGSTYQLKNDGQRGNTYTTDMNNTEDSVLCQIFGSGCKTGTQVTSTSTTFGNGTTSNRASAA